MDQITKIHYSIKTIWLTDLGHDGYKVSKEYALQYILANWKDITDAIVWVGELGLHPKIISLSEFVNLYLKEKINPSEMVNIYLMEEGEVGTR